MIAPFVDKQIRRPAAGAGPGPDGAADAAAAALPAVISYGLSSYGYDLRVSDEFKVFTNVFNTVVDPKRFDDRSFVDLKTEVCIVPPNSFALARSVEYFRIPRDILTICLGKSTYARCFRGDTRVALVDGTTPTLEDMAERARGGETFFGYSIGPHGRLIVTWLEAPRHVGRDGLLELTLDSGEQVHCTPDHEFLRRDGRLAAAADLRPGDSLMPLYRRLCRGYEAVYQPLNGHLDPTHRLADEWNVRHGLYRDEPGTHRHHLDHNRRNNHPGNLGRMERSAHLRLHNEQNDGEGFDRAEHGQAIRAALARSAIDPEWKRSYAEDQRRRAMTFWAHPRYAAVRESLLAKQTARWTARERLAQAERQQAFWETAGQGGRDACAERCRWAWAAADQSRRDRQREVARVWRRREDVTAQSLRSALEAAGSWRGAARRRNVDRAAFRRFPDVIGAFRGQPPGRNHKVAAVRALAGEHDVYCLTVPEAGNFALAAGVFVRNCGIIVNVTPFEPEWEGHVTLEISNTTPLPAKVYAHEGLAQVIFLQGAGTCEVSYADRQGKYMGQRGITVPRL